MVEFRKYEPVKEIKCEKCAHVLISSTGGTISGLGKIGCRKCGHTTVLVEPYSEKEVVNERITFEA